ncbi:hypothetical protein PtB15_5B359 [Puccinia triticina]|nr:hypothetical protein PtB15_5B359 [Puccinia triticina]
MKAYCKRSAASCPDGELDLVANSLILETTGFPYLSLAVPRPVLKRSQIPPFVLDADQPLSHKLIHLPQLYDLQPTRALTSLGTPLHRPHPHQPLHANADQPCAVLLKSRPPRSGPELTTPLDELLTWSRELYGQKGPLQRSPLPA